MKTRTKVALAVLCALLLVTVSILGTLAYLTSTETVTNTFTVGNVKITLDEAPVDSNGQQTTGARGNANSYKLYPGKTYDKDPTIHVDPNSDNCWLFVKIENNIAGVEDGSIATQMANNGWSPVDGTDVYAYKQIATKADANVKIFEKFTVTGEATNETLASYADKTIVVTGYAVQAEGFATAEAAWDATFGAPVTP